MIDCDTFSLQRHRRDSCLVARHAASSMGTSTRAGADRCRAVALGSERMRNRCSHAAACNKQQAAIRQNVAHELLLWLRNAAAAKRVGRLF